ncbi:MAG: DUF5675 family protein [Prevotellaceae bacterium]|jgi:hypothetical protein|nr:DUF5675 family protein [Prevotellaceae bacterium]
MELTLKRIAKKEKYTIGRLYIDGKYFCDTLEDTDRGLNQDMQLEHIKKIKIAGETAIPAGVYEVDMNTVSPKYKDRAQYKFCGGKLPRLVNVKGYTGILIHIGNYPKDTDGCILIGKNSVAGAVMDSTKTFNEFYPILRASADKGEKIIIKIE